MSPDVKPHWCLYEGKVAELVADTHKTIMRTGLQVLSCINCIPATNVGQILADISQRLIDLHSQGRCPRFCAGASHVSGPNSSIFFLYPKDHNEAFLAALSQVLITSIPSFPENFLRS